METQINHYGALIDKIRKDRKLSREELCEDIMSKRNYQRFATGEVSISSDKIQLITDKLMLDTYSLQEIYKTDNHDEYQKLKKAFNLILKWNETEANTILATINYDDIASSVNKQMYDFTNLLIKKGKKSITEAEFHNKIETLIGFPDILNKKILNSVELSGLFTLMAKKSKNGDNRIVDYLIKLLDSNKSVSYWLTNEIRIVINANLAKSLYYLEKHDQCIAICDEGIRISENLGRFIGLPNLLSFKLLSLHKLGLSREALDIAINLYMYVLAEGNENKIVFFRHIINQNLKLNIDEFLIIKKEG